MLCAGAFAASAGAKEVRLPSPHVGTFAEPKELAVDQGTGEIYAIDGRSEIQQVAVSATAGQFKLKFGALETGNLPFDASEAVVQEAMRTALCGGKPCVSVVSGQGNATGSNPYKILFVETLATTDVEQLVCLPGTPPLSGGSGCSVTTTSNGVDGTITRYQANGSPSEFPALGTNAIDGKGPGPDLTPQGGLHVASPRLVQVAVDESGGATDGDIYVAQFSDHLIDVFSPSGEFKGQLTEYGVSKPLAGVCGVAIDPSGNVYVADVSTGIHKYDPAANPVTNADSVANFTTVPSPCALGAGAGPTVGSLFATEFAGKVAKIDASSGELKYKFAEGDNTTITVDPVSGHVLTAAGSKVSEFDASGGSATQVGSVAAGSPVTGVAVKGSSGKSGTLYLAREDVSHLDVYGPLVAVPLVETKGASSVGTTGTLNGTISADGGPAATCHFEILTAATYAAQKKAAEEAAEPKTQGEIEEAAFAGAQSVPCEPPGPFSGSTVNPVSGKAEGLLLETDYEYRILGTNSNGQIAGNPQELETLGKPLIEGGSASQVSATSALISGAVNSRGVQTEVAVEYVTKAQFEATGFEGATIVPAAPLAGQITGTGDLAAATGMAIITAGSTQIPTFTTESGAFERGETITGIGIPSGTEILKVNEFGITLSKAATKTIGVTLGKGDLTAGSSTILNVKAEGEDEFVVGQEILAAGIPPHTTITSIEPSSGAFELGISAAAQASAAGTKLEGHGVRVSATSNRVKNLSTTSGRFGPGQAISGPGIAPGTTIVSAQEGQLVLSKPATERVVGSALTATGFQPVTVKLSGLTPATSYVFRLTAKSESGVADPGAAGSFTTFAVAGPPLPDGRAYEMVTPAVKAGEVFPPEPGPRTGLGSTCKACTPGFDKERMPMQATVDGDNVAFEGSPFSAGLSSGANEYVARRGAGGWATTGLSKPNYRDDAVAKEGFKALSPDLSRAVLLQSTPALSAQAIEGFANLYLQDEGTEALSTLITTEPPNRTPGTFLVNYAGANAGSEGVPAFSHVIFQANDALTAEEPGIAPEAPTIGAGARNLYEWSNGQLHLVNVLPGNGGAAANATIGSGLLLEAAGGAANFDFDHAISDDGSRIFWSAVPSGQVYVRVGGETTIEVPDPGKFLTASDDGSAVLLSDGMVYDLEDETLTDLTGGQGGFQGIAGAAEDLSRVYFVDTEALTGPEEENANGEAAAKGKPNLYLWEEGEVAHEGTVSFVGTLLAADNQGGDGGELGTWHAAQGNRLAQASPDGRFLAFESRAPLTGYDNANRFEVFEYDAQSQSLACASCRPSGEAPLGPSNLGLIFGRSDFFASQPQNLPPAGEGRLFFESQDTILQADTNGHIQDVYQWEPNGVGDCERPGGCVALISNGHSPKDSHFITASSSGNDVFFDTREQLVPQDKDDFLDLYDARVGGGFPEEGSAPCAGEACAGPIPPPPASEPPSSSLPRGEEKAPAKKHCKRGFVRRGNRCVRKPHKHRRHHRSTRGHRSGGAR